MGPGEVDCEEDERRHYSRSMSSEVIKWALTVSLGVEWGSNAAPRVSSSPFSSFVFAAFKSVFWLQ